MNKVRKCPSNQVRSIGIIGLILVFLTESYAQQRIDFKHIQEKEGLSYGLVNSILKDTKGFLWIGTYNGLNRFDGHHFTHFKKNRKNPDSLPDNVVHDLAQDQQGNIWYATNNGIGCYHQQTNRFENFLKIHKQPLEYVHNIVCDRADNIWFSTNRGLYKFTTKTRTFKLFEHKGTQVYSILKSANAKNGLIEDPHKNGLWMTSSGGLMYFDMDAGRFFHSKNNPQQLPIFKNEPATAIALSKAGEIAFGQNFNKIIVFDAQSLSLKKEITLFSKQTPLNDYLSAVFFDAANNIWVSSWAYALFFVEGKSGKINEPAHSESDKNSIAGNFFWGAFQDTDGTVMLGTSNGISYTNPEKTFYRVYDFSKKLPGLTKNEGIKAFCEDQNGWWWLGTESDGLIHYNPATGDMANYRFPKKGVFIKTLRLVGRRVFIGCEAGCFSFDPQTKIFTQLELPPEVTEDTPEIIDFELQSDSVLWLAGGGRYVLKYHLLRHTFKSFDVVKEVEVEKLKRYLPRITIDLKKEIWVSLGRGGLLKFSETLQRFIPIKSREKNEFETNFYKPLVDKKGDFWIPAGGYGLLKYAADQNRFTLWSESEGLVSDQIGSLAGDPTGCLWMAAYNKFSIFNPSKNSFLNFVLPINEANYAYGTVLFQLRNHHIIALMKGEIVEFFPSKIHNRILQNAPLISSIVLKNSPIRYTSNHSNIYLEVDRNNFTINYGYLPLSQSTRYQFYYKLEGFDKDWVNAGNDTHANYTNLAGGDYTFKVKTANGDSVSPISEIQIHIDTVFYKTTWFLTVLILSSLGMIYALYRYRLHQSARFHQMQLHTSALEKDKTEMQYQNLINHLNPHFLFNSLTSLNSLITINPKLASDFLEKLSLIYRYILQNKEKEWVSLESELRFVQHYIDLQKSRFEEGLQIVIHVPEKYFSKNIVPVTLQNLIENAIKHNIIDDDLPLFISIHAANDYLIIGNNLQKKQFVETSNKQGLAALRHLYRYLTADPLEVLETETEFIVKVPLL